MKSHLRFTISILLFSLCLTLGMMAQAAVVSIPDATLRAVLESALGKNTGDVITDAELGTITSLQMNSWRLDDNYGGGRVSDLTGLEYCLNLNDLDLNGNPIDEADLSKLAGLTKLSSLNLGNNELIQSLSALQNLTKLVKLDLNHNNGQGRINDISVVQTMPELQSLNMFGNQISDISSLQNKASLTDLQINGRHNSGVRLDHALAVIPTLTNLTKLSIGYIPLTNESIPPLVGNLTDLASFNHWNNESGEGLLSDLSPFTSLSKLTSLSIEGNSIQSLSPLQSLPNLRHLRLRGNYIEDLTGLNGLQVLEELSLEGNRISNISALSGLNNLRILNLKNNEITDLQALLNNAGIGNGDKVELENNPLSQEVIDNQILALRARGVTVTHSEPGVVVAVPDDSLRVKLLEALNRSNSYQLTRTDLESLGNGKQDWLNANDAKINDLTGLEYCINLRYLYLRNNQISDITALSNLTKLDNLDLNGNPLKEDALLIVESLRARGTKVSYDMPKITGPWLWMTVDTSTSGSGALNSGTDWLSQASTGSVTEAQVANSGVAAGQAVGAKVWKAATISATGGNNMNDVVTGVGCYLDNVDKVYQCHIFICTSCLRLFLMSLY